MIRSRDADVNCLWVAGRGLFEPACFIARVDEGVFRLCGECTVLKLSDMR